MRTPDGLDELMENREALEGLLQSEEARTLAALFRAAGGEGLRTAAQEAAAGDGGKLRALLDRVMADPAGARAVEDLKKKAPR